MIPDVAKKHFAEWRDVCQVRGWSSSDRALRHAVYQAALGEDKDWQHFNDADWDRVFARLKRLLDPDDLNAVMEVERYINHDVAQANHEPVVQPGKPRGRTYELRSTPSRYERKTEVDDPGERKRRVYGISRLFEPRLIDSICRDRWDRSDWQDMPLPQLTELRDLLKNRLGKFITKVKQGRINYDFGFALNNPATGRDFSNGDIIARLLKRGVPVRMMAPAAPTLMETLRDRRRHHRLVGGPMPKAVPDPF
jgi:hypothetical protein